MGNINEWYVKSIPDYLFADYLVCMLCVQFKIFFLHNYIFLQMGMFLTTTTGLGKEKKITFQQ
jgi:hypothetical protein